MRTSQLLLATLKETPADAEVISHQLMIRAGMIRKLASGLYTWLPLGLRVLRRVAPETIASLGDGNFFQVEQIIRSASIWEKTSEKRRSVMRACDSSGLMLPPSSVLVPVLT